jgi:DNA-binding transcriptional ArsR family regulator
MNKVFKALADRTRRHMLDRLFDSAGLTLTELTDGLGMTRQSASRHLAILEDSGLVVAHWQGREKLHYLNPLPIADISDRWLSKFSRDKARAVLRLKLALQGNEPGDKQ